MFQDNNGGCDQVCSNRPGTFMCECNPGYSGSITCLDINECLLNNGHGPCQDTCSNTHGGYEARSRVFRISNKRTRCFIQNTSIYYKVSSSAEGTVMTRDL